MNQNDQAIEQQIQAKGKTAPRVTPADIEANIRHIETVKHVTQSGQVLRWAVLITQSGFAVVGKPSVAVSPENDDAEIGEQVAFQNSREELWPLMGYALKQDLHRRAAFDAEPKTSDEARMQQHLDMVRQSGYVPGDGEGQQTAPDAHQQHIQGWQAAEQTMQHSPGAALQASPAHGDFGFALAWLKAGARVARAGWNGKGMFVYLVPANAYPAQTGAAKAHFGEGALVPYNAYLALKGADDTVSTWAPSGSDALAEDWLIVE